MTSLTLWEAHDAARIKLASLFPDGTDPTPWLVVPDDPMLGHNWKLGEAAWRYLGVALQSGALSAHLANGKELPASVWQPFAYIIQMRYGFHPSPFWDAEWTQQMGAGVYLDGPQFCKWMQRNLTKKGCAGMAKAPIDCIEAMPEREVIPLPDGPFVSLAHAISWAAWHKSISSEGLKYLRAEQWLAMRDSFAEALKAICTLGQDGEALPMRGHWKATDRGNSAPNAAIDPAHLMDFQRYCMHEDGLRHGQGLVSVDGPEPIGNILGADLGAYDGVTVHRGKLLDLFPAPTQIFAKQPSSSGRKRGDGSFAALDAPFVDAIIMLVRSKTVASASEGARIVHAQNADKIKGNQSAAVKRLAEATNKKLKELGAR